MRATLLGGAALVLAAACTNDYGHYRYPHVVPTAVDGGLDGAAGGGGGGSSEPTGGAGGNGTSARAR